MVARFLSNSAVLSLLLVIGIAGIWIEIKAPGIGLPGLVGVLGIGLYFAGSYLANLSGFVEWIVFAVGLILLVLEIYVLPGFGVAGVAGISMMMGALFFALFNLAPDEGGWIMTFGGLRLTMLGHSALLIVLALLGLIPFLILLGKLFPSTPLYRGLVLDPAQGGARQMTPQPERDDPAHGIAPGHAGKTVTGLYPTGVAVFGGVRTDVLTEGEYVEKGTEIEVLRVEGARIVVRRRG
jgi:membrane-bound serine protease (ClpP class)